MFVKLAVIAFWVALSSGAWHGPLAGGEPADKYPAGVSPQACPNFPNCNNPALAANPNAPAPAYDTAPRYQAAYPTTPSYNRGYVSEPNPEFTGVYAPKNVEESGKYTGDGDYRGEGLAESGAYGVAAQPSYITAAPVYQPSLQSNQLPAGVAPHACHNYPYCN